MQVVYSDLDQSLGKSRLTNADAVFQSIVNILRTKKGSRIFFGAFGSSLEDILFDPMDDEVAFSIIVEVIDCIRRWEPRAILVTNMCKVTPDYDNHVYWTHLAFKIEGLGETVFNYELGFKKP